MTAEELIGAKQSSRFLVFLTHAPLAIAIVMRFGSPLTAGLAYVVLAIYALFGPANTIRALALSWLLTMINPAIAPDPLGWSLGRQIVLLAAAVPGVLQFLTNFKTSRFSLLTFLFGLFILLHSLFISLIVEVSLLKAFIWLVVVLAMFSSWRQLSFRQMQEVSSQLFLMLVSVLLASFALSKSDIGYLSNGAGLQGVLNQPQAFGVTIAILGAWVVGEILNQRRPPWKMFALAGGCVVAILMSEARTAGIAMLLGVVISIVLVSILTHVPGLRNKRLWSVTLVGLVVMVAMFPFIADVAESFLVKRYDLHGYGLIEAYISSRAILFQPMFANIQEYFYTGIGFGIPSNPEAITIARDPIFGLPLGAPIEKGTVPIMVIEELGLLGLVFFTIWVLVMVSICGRNGVVQLSVCLTILLSNLGEASLFSPGGMGLLSLIMLGWATAGYPQKNLG